MPWVGHGHGKNGAAISPTGVDVSLTKIVAGSTYDFAPSKGYLQRLYVLWYVFPIHSKGTCGIDATFQQDLEQRRARVVIVTKDFIALISKCL